MSKRIQDIYALEMESLVRRMEPLLTDDEVADSVRRLDAMSEQTFGVWLRGVHGALKGDERL